jgi:hypothetical protein
MFAGVIVPDPSTSSARPEAIAPATAPASGVPAATRVIRLELDPDWQERAGGR